MQNKSEGYIREDIEYLEKWLKQVENMAQNIRSQSQKEGGLAIFTISTTVKMRDNRRPYLTPIRRIIHGFIGGSVVFSQTQAILFCKQIDGLVDQILVDSEKKIGITIGLNEDVLKYFSLRPPPQKGYSRVPVEMGNLSAACAGYIEKSDFYEYKPNDMTVEAVWCFLSNWYKVLSGKKIAIIGGGNIGFKLALKLVESGSNVQFVRRDLGRGTLMADAINVAKPKSTIAMALYNPDPLQASLFCDVLIGCTNGLPAITWEMIQSMKPNGIVIDVGKGSVFKDAVQKAVKNKIHIIRCDISSAIDGIISTIQRNKQIVEKEMGRREIEKGIFVVSGGKMGQDGDIVVDNYTKPLQSFGVADGAGDMKQDLSELDKKNIVRVRELIKHEKA